MWLVFRMFLQRRNVQITRIDNSNSIDDERLFALLNTERKHLSGEH